VEGSSEVRLELMKWLSERAENALVSKLVLTELLQLMIGKGVLSVDEGRDLIARAETELEVERARVKEFFAHAGLFWSGLDFA
jgi:hypothetical protein